MRAAASLLYEHEDEFSKPSNSKAKGSVHFNANPEIVEPTSELPPVPNREVPSLMGVNISRTPLLSLASLDASPDEPKVSKRAMPINISGRPASSHDRKESLKMSTSDDVCGPSERPYESLPTPMPGTNLPLEDPFDVIHTTERGAETQIELPIRSSELDRLADVDMANRSSQLSVGETIKHDDSDATRPLKDRSLFRGHLGDVESSDAAETMLNKKTPFCISTPSSEELESPLVFTKDIMKDRESCKAPRLPLRETRNLPGSRCVRNEPRSTAPSKKSVQLSKTPLYTLQCSNDENKEHQVVNSPPMGSQKSWLLVQAERASRYHEVMDESDDEDKDARVRSTPLSSLEASFPQSAAREDYDSEGPSLFDNARITLIPDECVSPLHLGRESCSPTDEPLPKSENLLSPNIFGDHSSESWAQQTPQLASSPPKALDTPSPANIPLLASMLVPQQPHCNDGSSYNWHGEQEQPSERQMRSSGGDHAATPVQIPTSADSQTLLGGDRINNLEGADAVLSRICDKTSPSFIATLKQAIHDQGYDENRLGPSVCTENTKENNESSDFSRPVRILNDPRKISLSDHRFHLSPTPPFFNLRDELAGAGAPLRSLSEDTSNTGSETLALTNDEDDGKFHASSYPGVARQAVWSTKYPLSEPRPVADSRASIGNTCRLPSDSTDVDSLAFGSELERVERRRSDGALFPYARKSHEGSQDTLD
ncbi:MAG: hypothetical protein Q9227_000930 [Pyrenula ochraceoflavens]